MDILIIEEKANGLKTKAVGVLLKDGQIVRRCEVVVDQAEDAAGYVQSHAVELWAEATTTDMAWWLSIRERQYRAYYYAILRAVDGVRDAGGSLDMALAGGLQAINADADKRAEFDRWRTMCQLTDPQTVQDKRDLLMGLLLFANSGLIGGAKL